MALQLTITITVLQSNLHVTLHAIMSLAPSPAPASPATAASSPYPQPQPPTTLPPSTSPRLSPPPPAAPTPTPPVPPTLVAPAIDHAPPLPPVATLPMSPPPAILISPITSPPAPLPPSVSPPPHAAGVVAPVASPPPPPARKSVHSPPLPTTPSKPKPPAPPTPKSTSPPSSIPPLAAGPPPLEITPLKPSLPPPISHPADSPLLVLVPPPPTTLPPSVFSNEAPLYQASRSPSPSPSLPLPLAVSNGSFEGSSSRSSHSSTGLIVGCISIGALLFVVVAVVCICCKGRNKNNKSPVKNHKLSPFQPKGKSSILSPHGSQGVLPSENHVVTMTLQPQAAASPPVLISSIGGHVSSNSDPAAGSTPQVSHSALDSSNGSFTYEELVAATNGFSDANLLGQGGFGYVHKGVLPNGKEVAVKQLRAGSHQGEREFQAELETISRVHHKHLVPLLGYCISGNQRLLVYEFFPNKTLEFHLHEEGQPVLDWETRLKIAIGAAKGLAYLHEDCNPRIIHRDIKAANILLDSKFEAKVSDFGLAKYFNKSSPFTHISTRVIGTFGYMAPEYASTGQLTDRSDVYSYGVVLLELITGRPAIGIKESSSNRSLVEWARPLLSQAMQDGDFQPLADPKLKGKYNESEMSSMVGCAAACVRHSGWLRPPMSQVVRALEGDTSVAYLEEGIRPTLNTISISSESWIYTDQHEDMTGPNKLSIGRTYAISGCSASTSEYGLNTASTLSNNSR